MGVMSGIAKIVLLCCAISGSQSVNPRAQNNSGAGLKLALIVPPSPFKVGDKMWLDVTLTNISSEPVTTLSPPGMDLGDIYFRVDLFGGDSKPVSRWRDLYPKAAGSENTGSGSITMMILQPGGIVKRRVDLRTRFKIEEPGTYSVRVLFEDSKKNLHSESNSVTFEVLPASS